MDLNAYINGVSRKVQDAVNTILNSDGIRGISCEKEYDQLAGLLAGTKNKGDTEYIEGFMLEWEDRKKAAQPPEAEKAPEEAKPSEEKPVEKKEDKPNKAEVKPEEPPVKKEPKKVPPAKSKPVPVPVPVQTAPNIVNDNDTNQGGKNNINVGNGGSVIINNGMPVGIGVPFPPNVNPGQPVDSTEPITDDPWTPPADTVKPRDLDPAEIKEARDAGEEVADKLLGYTTNTEQRVVQDIVAKEINSNNIIEFLRGYEKGRDEDKDLNLSGAIAGALVGGANIVRPRDHFFEQLRTESNFPEKQDLMRKVATDLQAYLSNKHGVDSAIAKEVAVILLEETLGEYEAKKLDKIALEELGKQQEARRNTPPIRGVAGIAIEHIKNTVE